MFIPCPVLALAMLDALQLDTVSTKGSVSGLLIHDEINAGPCRWCRISLRPSGANMAWRDEFKHSDWMYQRRWAFRTPFLLIMSSIITFLMLFHWLLVSITDRHSSSSDQADDIDHRVVRLKGLPLMHVF